MAAVQDESLPYPELEQKMNTSARFPSLMVLLHWLTLGFLVLSAACVFGRDLVGSRSDRLWLLAAHWHLGLLIVCATCARLACRFLFKDTLRTIESSLSQPVRLIAHATHSLLCGLLLGLPLLGWMLSNARGTAVIFLGLMRLPSLAPLDLDRADTLATWHQWGGLGPLRPGCLPRCSGVVASLSHQGSHPAGHAAGLARRPQGPEPHQLNRGDMRHHD